MKTPERIEENRKVRLGEAEVSFVLRRSTRRRSVALQVDERGLTVSVPWRCSEGRLQQVLRDAEGWVLRKLATWTHDRPAPPSWRSGDLLPFLGTSLTLEIATATRRPRVLRLHDRLLVTVVSPVDSLAVQKLATNWLRREALDIFSGHSARLAPLMGVDTPRVFLSNARTRWGSCNGDGSIRVNWRLVQVREALIEYVVVHELAHFREMNHGPRFWNHVARACPDYRARRAELNEIGRRLLSLSEPQAASPAAV